MKKFFLLPVVGLVLAINSTSVSANSKCNWNPNWDGLVVRTWMLTKDCPDDKSGKHYNLTKSFVSTLFSWSELDADLQGPSTRDPTNHVNPLWGAPGIHTCKLRGYYETQNGSFRKFKEENGFCL